jgi:hypothetical protein
LWYYLRFFALVILAPDLAAAFLAAALPLALYEYDFPFTIGIVYLRFLAVLAACVKFFEVGAPLLPGLRIFSPEPSLIRLRLAWMFAYKPRLAITTSPCQPSKLHSFYL